MIPKPPEHVVTIDDADTLHAFAKRMARREWIAVDTEFLRERTYYPKLCLVQLADADEIGLIDVIAIDDLSPLAKLLRDARVIKVFHSAEQDLEVLSQRFGGVPAPLFDTQVAAPLAGYSDQMGYARLINALLDIELAKAHTRTDWSKRPLPRGALDYAADDVRYLAVAYIALHDTLAERGRLDWLTPDFERMTDTARFEIDPDQAWRRLRNWHRLKPAAQQVLAELAAWREREAMGADRPRKWILGNDAIMDIARRLPADSQALAGIDTLPSKTAARHGRALLDAVAAGLEKPATPIAEPPVPPDTAEKRRIQAGMAQLDECAAKAGIASSAIGSRKEIAAMVAGQRNLRLLAGWRRKVAGEAVLATVAQAATDEG